MIVFPGISGVPGVIVPAAMEEPKPPPSGWVGGVSTLVPSTVAVPPPVSVTVMMPEFLALKSAMVAPAGGKDVISMIRKRKRVTGAPVLFVKALLIESVPKVELLGASLVESRTRFGGSAAATNGSRRVVKNVELRSSGEARFSGPGAPRR